ESREMVELAVAPREVREMKALHRALVHAGVKASVVRRATDTENRWVELRMRFLPEEAAPLLAIRGVHGTPTVERVSPTGEGTRRIVGLVDADGKAVDGIELALDSMLQGVQGRSRYLRDARGGSFDSPAVETEEPRPGNTVVLTLNHALQDIAEHALSEAIDKTGSSGGDIVVLDPHNGDILALVSQREGRAMGGVPALTDTYEPGSTIKPFLAARLLALGRTNPDEVIDVHDGSYMAPGRRTPIRDTHRAASLTVADVLRYSSNVGMVRLAERLTPREQYEGLRDVGFGVSTGIAFPTEASGVLPQPGRWSLTTPAALAMGYEMGVTPLQLANAYATIANGGELLEPALVKEVRAPDGEVLYRRSTRVVRRAMPETVAATLRNLLTAVVDSGTGTSATLSTYDVGGKSGTARLSTGRGYEGGAYTASFVAIFPAEAPQLVVLVKLDRPEGKFYGGATAGPVSKAVLEAALAARDAALDRGDLVRGARAAWRGGKGAGRPAAVARQVNDDTPRATSGGTGEPIAGSGAGRLGPDGPDGRDIGTGSVQPAVRFDLAAELEPASGPAGGLRTVPDVGGLPLRAAVARLHSAGFLVRIVPRTSGTVPAAGTLAPAGAVVRLGAPR
ncbi:MAG: penicillin-binding transpeptidase domain-containing protein, partial [Gemmatimonadaceae bacterium]